MAIASLVATTNIRCDVTVQFRKIEQFEQDKPRDNLFFIGETPGVGTFLVSDGAEIVIDSPPGIDESLLGALFLGPLMAVLLRQRGLAVLHGSSVATDRGVIAFVGDSGAGKSTLARSFYNRGYGVLTDDVMAIDLAGNAARVIPGYPAVKLFPETASFLACDENVNKPVPTHTAKHYHPVVSRFPQNPLELRHIYVLVNAESDSIEALPPREAFVELVHNSRAVTLLRDSQSRAMHLSQCTRLAAAVPMFRLRRHRALSFLPELVRLIEDHLA